MTTSGLCISDNCVTRVGTTSSSQVSFVNQAVEAFLQEQITDEYTLNSLPNLKFKSNVGSVNLQETTISNLVRNYGEEAFYESVVGFNNYFNREEIRDLITEETFPRLYERINNDLIFTPIEVAEFTFEFQYTPINLLDQTNVLSPKLCQEAENFYNNNLSQSIMGSFCSLMPNIFGAVGQFFTFIDNVEGFIGNIKKLGDSIKGLLDGGLKNLLAGLVEQIKSKLLSAVDKIVEKYKNILQNFSMENIIGEVQNFVGDKLLGKFYQLKEEAEAFFNDLNVQTIKKKMEALVDYAGGLFKEITLDEIQFLIFRFCSVTSQIEQGLGSILNPVKAYASNYKNTVEVLTNSSNRNTARAVAAGAFRLPANVADEKRNAASGGGGGAAVPLGDIRPFTDEEYKGITQWNDGKGDSKVTFAGSVASSEWAWKEVDIRTRALLMRVQKRFGKQVTVISGRRSYEKQMALYKNYIAKGKTGGQVAHPDTGPHVQGHALDVTWSGFSRSSGKEFLTIAVEEGFRGIGGYPSSSFVHIDLGARRSWGDTFGVVPGPPVDKTYDDKTAPPNDDDVNAAASDAIDKNATQDTSPSWTTEEASQMDGLRELNIAAGGSGTFTGNRLTDGERAYVASKGWLDTSPPPTSTTGPS